MLKTFLLAGLSALVFSGCSTTAISSANSDNGISPEGRLYADYLVGSYADFLGDAEARSKHYSQAYVQARHDIVLGRRAMTSALRAGDPDLARTLARTVNSVDVSEPVSRAILGAYEFSNGHYDRAMRYFDQPTPDFTVRILINLMKGWAEAERGNPDEARIAFSSIDGGSYFDSLGALQIYILEARYGDMETALEGFSMAQDSGVAVIETALAHTRALVKSGDRTGAMHFIANFNTENGPFETGPVARMIGDLGDGAIIQTDLRAQVLAARAITESAVGFFVYNRAPDVAEVFLQIALDLDPDHDKARLRLGSLLENSDRDREAVALYKTIPESSPYIVPARLSEANIYFGRNEDEKALAVLEATNTGHPSFVTRESLGRARLIRENYKEALPLYDALVRSMSGEELKANPEPLYFRGICYERTEQWEKAVVDFKKVLEINPDNADALNYLGYTWVDRGENLEEAFHMIKRAVELEPDSGAITDSLGWAYYRLGQYQKAREYLEKAVELSPSNATIIDHLGDVYRKLGRYREARYQWERALEFEPTEKEEKAIKQKLGGGLSLVDSGP
ncbi:MAG: tetratricopeptide repeat protein [Hyphomonadaceae bacterium]|nr:tetratricopeptide repeat protein [Hyphomonadaceae bacterium]MBC6411806.1 tetratricopeptide repeat protein [Hyphomonadaceae bacterium]